jgi:3',5'-cyclic AMP phosphodiesterase CpdA
MGNNLTFVHFTDTHVQPEGADPLMGQNTYQRLRDAVDLVHVLSIRPAFYVISGDLVHETQEDGYERLKEIVDELHGADNVPVFMCMGNHDVRVPFRKVFLGQVETDENQPYYFSQLIGDLRVIVLDSKVSGKDNGTLDAEQLAWLASELATPAAGGNLIIVHHPPITNSVMSQDHLLTNADALAEVLHGHPIHGILCGHIHFNSIGLFNGILCAAGAGVAFTLDPNATDGLRILNGSGFNLVALRDGHLTVNPHIMPGEQKEVHYYKPAEQAAIEEMH